MFVFTDFIKREEFDNKVLCCPSHPGLGVSKSESALELESNFKSRDLVKWVPGSPVVLSGRWISLENQGGNVERRGLTGAGGQKAGRLDDSGRQ